MKIQITKDIHINNNQIMKKGTVLNLPHREETKNYTIIAEYQDRSFFFESYVSLYCIDGSETFGIPLQEHKRNLSWKKICKLSCFDGTVNLKKSKQIIKLKQHPQTKKITHK